MDQPPRKLRSLPLLPQLLWRVLPLAALILIAVWYGTSRLIYSTVETELIEKLDREAEFGARTIGTRLDTLISGMRAVAANDLIINSLIDLEARQAYIPTFMQSLRLPGPTNAKITLTDYRGRPIASNVADLNRSDYFIANSAIAGTYTDFSEFGLTVAVPIIYQGRQEGAIVVKYGQLGAQELLNLDMPATASALLKGGSVLYSSNLAVSVEKFSGDTAAMEGWVCRKATVPGHPLLQVVVAEPADKAFATAHEIGQLMLLAAVLALVALGAGITFTAYLATRPLKGFIDEIESISDAEDLGKRVTANHLWWHLALFQSSGAAEFEHLANTFNSMLERMRAMVMSNDRLDKENRHRKRNEQSLRESERRYRELIDGSARGIYICRNNRILFTNRAFAEMFGFANPDEARSFGSVDDVLGRDHRKVLQDQLTLAGDAASETLRSELCLKPNRKDEVWFENMSRTIMWGGKPAIEGSLIDISDRKIVEQLKSEFVSIVSHELRTPLTSMVGSLGLIRSGALGELPEKVEPLVSIAHTNTERLVALVNDILDIEKIELGHMDFRMERIEVLALANQALSENAFFGANYGVEFVLETDLKNGYINGDRDRLLQVLANLLSNAAKFSPQGATVKLHVTSGDTAIRFAVADRGPGIPQAMQQEIFKKFNQGDTSDSRTKTGTGLGLSICKAIVEHHGDQLRIESEVGRGSVFYFELPWTSMVLDGKPVDLASTIG